MATHRFVPSTMDYSNSLFYGLPNTQLGKLQTVQNAAYIVLIQATKIWQKGYNSAVRKDLHWLPSKARIEFKMLNLALKAYNGTNLGYLNDLLHEREITHNTRWSNTNLLKLPPTKLVTCWSFQKAAPAVWKYFPAHLWSLNQLHPSKPNTNHNYLPNTTKHRCTIITVSVNMH